MPMQLAKVFRPIDQADDAATGSPLRFEEIPKAEQSLATKRLLDAINNGTSGINEWCVHNCKATRERPASRYRRRSYNVST